MEGGTRGRLEAGLQCVAEKRSVRRGELRGGGVYKRVGARTGLEGPVGSCAVVLACGMDSLPHRRPQRRIRPPMSYGGPPVNAALHGPGLPQEVIGQLERQVLG